MSTQGILISGNSNINSAENTKSRERTVAAAVSSGQENRSAENPLRNRVKSPAKLFKSQLRFSVNPKPESTLLTSNDKKNNLHPKITPKSTTQVNPKLPVNPTTEGKPNPQKPNPKPESIPSMIRRESANNFRTLKSSLTNPRSSKANSGGTNTNSLVVTNPKPTSGESKLRSTGSISNLRIRQSQAVPANRTASGNKVGTSRTNSSHKLPSISNGGIPLTRSSSNQPQLRSPPPSSPKAPKIPNCTPTSLGDMSDKSRVAPEFPEAPVNPEKHFPAGSDKLAQKIWMKERAMFDKWESSKKLFQMKLAEGNLSACQRIVDRLNSEMEELTKAIREDECRRLFPPEQPVKPAESCPLNAKDARLWHQQKVVYESWDDAFKLFQENMTKGDTTACKKQMTIYNPQYKELLTQPSRRFDNLQISTPTEDIPNSKLQVKFSDAISISQNSTTNPQNTQIVIPKVRPKLQPPASWTKLKNRASQEKSANLFKSQEVSMAEMLVSQEVKVDTTTDIEVVGTSEVSHSSDTSCIEHNITSTSSDLIDAIDSVLAELDAKKFCNNLSS